MNTLTTKTIRVEALARVEGEGAVNVKVREGQVQEVEFRIFEPPRFFEAFLRGRRAEEAPDITSRICGICPVAYQMSAAQAMEQLAGVQVPEPIRRLRRLLYCGEWIESHVLHVYFLHAPDFLGYADAVQMAGDHPGIIQNALEMKKVGNAIVTLLGGREVHPVNVRLGGFYRVPAAREWTMLTEQLKRARETALGMVQWTAQLPLPDFEQDYEFVALHHPHEYAINEGRLISNRGLDVEVAGFDEFLVEEHVPYSTALQGSLAGRANYLVGPLARYNLNFDQLSPLAQEAAQMAGINAACRNPFQSIVVRSIETLYAVDEALHILEQDEMPVQPYASVPVRAGAGYGCTEAPRGILYHRYHVDAGGVIVDARIVPPTAQNQKTIEQDLRRYVATHAHLPLNELTWQCEQVVRNYDPCISCSTHFVRLQVER